MKIENARNMQYFIKPQKLLVIWFPRFVPLIFGNYFGILRKLSNHMNHEHLKHNDLL